MNTDSQKPKLFLVGNPNVGKSVIFGALTGTYATVSNFPGTTVTLSNGEAKIEGTQYELIDTPGINSLIPMSEDERVTRDLLLENEGVVIQVADAKNLERALPLTFQLQKMNLKFVLVVNMCDEADRVGIQINFKKLENILGVPVIPTVAIRGEGLALLKKSLKEAKESSYLWNYSPRFSSAMNKIEKELPKNKKGKEAISAMLLSGERYIAERLKKEIFPPSLENIEKECRQTASQFAEPVGFLLNRERIALAQSLLKRVLTTKRERRNPFWDWMGKMAMHPLWGILVLLGVLEGVYLFVGKFGAGAAVDFVETGIFGKYISPGAIWVVDHIFSFPHVHDVEEGMIVGSYVASEGGSSFLQTLHDSLVGPYGAITMGVSYGFALVLPTVTTLFIAFSLMEDSGYLPRLAVVINRFFKWMGLNGKAVLPMVLGLGCDTMATLTARILETRKQRIIVTLLLALAVPCSAQLGILLGMFGTMPAWTFWVWFGVITGVLFFVGFASNMLISGESTAFVMEIPPLRKPQFSNVAKKTLSRLEWYVKEAIPLFLLGTFILFLLDAFHLLASIQKGLSPIVVSLLGLPKEAANAFLIGFLRRDYGATGFFDMYSHGNLSVVQALIGLVVITLFVPCVANVFMIIKEHGGKVALRIVGFIFPFAFLVGGILNWILK